MISVTEALERIFSLLAPVSCETVTLEGAAGRVLRKSVKATRAHPPFPASAMDGYAVLGKNAKGGEKFKLIGQSSAGKRFTGVLQRGEAVRIFTGAPVPGEADRILIQEDVRLDKDHITLNSDADTKSYIRPAAFDFKVGSEVPAPKRLNSADVALLAAMNQPELCVARRPKIALIATGDELVLPGQTPGPDQIICSNSYGLKARLEAEGACVEIMPIARDTTADLTRCFSQAIGADLIVSLGGASVGAYDLVHEAALAMGFEQTFYKIAMRPGKPLIAGHLKQTALIGLPGNPVSAMVCGEIFLVPAIRRLQGLPALPRHRLSASLAHPIGANGPREHYMRAHFNGGVITPFECQDSAVLSVFQAANALLIRQSNEPALNAGASVSYIRLCHGD